MDTLQNFLRHTTVSADFIGICSIGSNRSQIPAGAVLTHLLNGQGASPGRAVVERHSFLYMAIAGEE